MYIAGTPARPPCRCFAIPSGWDNLVGSSATSQQQRAPPAAAPHPFDITDWRHACRTAEDWAVRGGKGGTRTALGVDVMAWAGPAAARLQGPHLTADCRVAEAARAASPSETGWGPACSAQPAGPDVAAAAGASGPRPTEALPAGPQRRTTCLGDCLATASTRLVRLCRQGTDTKPGVKLQTNCASESSGAADQTRQERGRWSGR